MERGSGILFGNFLGFGFVTDDATVFSFILKFRLRLSVVTVFSISMSSRAGGLVLVPS